MCHGKAKYAKVGTDQLVSAYYVLSIIIILVFRVCVFVISEFSGMGHPSDTLLSPMWRALSGELQRLHLESTGRLLLERKPLELFTGNA